MFLNQLKSSLKFLSDDNRQKIPGTKTFAPKRPGLLVIIKAQNAANAKIVLDQFDKYLSLNSS